MSSKINKQFKSLMRDIADNVPTVGSQKIFAVTGTFHGSLIQCRTEGEARRIFHHFYNGESITNIREMKYLIA